MPNFAPHGLFESYVKERVFLVKCIGAWNAEIMQEYGLDCYKKTSSLLGKPWAMFTDINEWELATKDSEPMLTKLVDSAIKHGLCREAVFSEQGVIKIEQFNQTQPDRPGFQRKFFTSKTEALQWLEEQGFSINE